MSGSPPNRTGHVRRTIFVCAIFCFAFRGVFGLDPAKAVTQYIQTSWTSEAGLPQNSVHAIAQTTDGFLWFGTEEGLARFDGRHFRIYDRSHTGALASDYIRTLCASHDGSLWIGTDSGLSHFYSNPSVQPADLGSLRAGYMVTFTTRDGLMGNNIASLYETADGAIWVGTNQGLSRIRGGKIESWTSANGLAGNEVNAITADSTGALWIATDEGLSRLDKGRFTSWTTTQGLPGNRVVALSVDSGDSIWASILGHGLVEIRAGGVVAPRLPWQEINALLRDRDGALWIAFDRHGLGRFFQGKLTLYGNANGLPSDRTTRALFEDREGDLWIGSLDAGLVQLRDGKFSVFGKPEGLPGNYVGNLLQARDGSMWFGSDSNGVTHLLPDGRVELWNHHRGLPDEAVYSILQTHDGSLWVGYRRGALAHIVDGIVTVFHDPAALDTSLNALFQDREGNLWVGYFGRGLARFSGGHFQHMNDSERIPAITESPDGAIWVATDGDGVERIFHGTTTRFTSASGLPSNHVMSLYAEANGDVWVGTASGGLSRIRGSQLTSWTPDQGLTDATIGSIIEDNQGDLWVGGDSGIARISRSELDSPGRAIHPRLFGSADGLRSRETLYGSMPCVWKDVSGRLWFTTIMGAAVIDPERMPADTVNPPVWIENAVVDSQTIVPHEGMRLGPGSGNMEFEFTAPTFVAPEKENFRYRLTGFDRDWIDAGSRRQAWYTNLPPGRYRFSVQAQNSDGKWNISGASFSFVLVPPLTRTPLAYAGYGIAALLIGWYTIRFRTRVLLRRQRELCRIVAERTEQLEAEKKALESARRELQTRATYDSLTGLFNRGAILEGLEHEISRALRDGTTLGVIIADLDHFKRINDSYGHLCGDEVIRETANRLRAALRSYDLAGRYGGEEFLIVLPGWDAAHAPDRVVALLEAIRSRPYLVSGVELRVTWSVGATTLRPTTDAPDTLEVLRRADAELYVAKQGGRDRASVTQPPKDSSQQLVQRVPF